MSEMKSLTLNDKTYDCFVDGVARSSVVVSSASGESIAVSDSSDQPLVGLNIYGKSTQAGTPTPDAPVDIESIGDDGDVVVTVDNDTLALMLDNGLRGIPVTDKTLATYTDANGQMWCADEIDLARGVYVKRIKVETLGQTTPFKDSYSGAFIVDRTDALQINKDNQGTLVGMMCDSYQARVWTAISALSQDGVALVWGNGLAVRDSKFTTVDDFNNHIAANPITVHYILATPIEIQLSDEEIAAYKRLHTNKPNTTAHNDSGAYMTLKYVADAKSYIDNKVSGILAATVE